MFVLGISQGFNSPKDTLKNLLETGECTVNIVSEWFAEAAYNCPLMCASHLGDQW